MPEARRARRDVNRVNEEWFSDMDAVRRKVGISEEQPVASTSGKVRGEAGALCWQSSAGRFCFALFLHAAGSGARLQRGTLTAAAALQETCQICFDEVPVRVMRSARCRHRFCLDCWRGYVTNAINSGPSALNLRCPLPECSAAVRPRVSLPYGD